MVCDLNPVSQNNCTIRMLLQYHMQTNYLASQVVPCTCRRVPLQETFLHRILTGKGYDYENTADDCDNPARNHHADNTQSHSADDDDDACEMSRVDLQPSFVQCRRRLSLRQNSSVVMDSSSSCFPFIVNSQRHFDRSEPLSASSVSSPSLLTSQHFSSMECIPPHPKEFNPSSSSSYHPSSSMESE